MGKKLPLPHKFQCSNFSAFYQIWEVVKIYSGGGIFKTSNRRIKPSSRICFTILAGIFFLHILMAVPSNNLYYSHTTNQDLYDVLFLFLQQHASKLTIVS